MKKRIVAMLLAGGQGSRLGVLTSSMAKPAVPFGGKYRIIDFPLSNCVNSEIDTVGVLTQYRPLALNSYIGTGQHWDLDRMNGGVFVLPPYVTGADGQWYTGTANAIWQNREFISQYDPDDVLILSGDHVYMMDYGDMLRFHRKKSAAATIAVLPVPMEEAHRFGIMNADENKRILSFDEKPAVPKSNLASMGIYIFDWQLLHEYMRRDDECDSSYHDFGRDIIPAMLADGLPMYAYPFEGYWKDVGTIKSLWETNMDLINDPPKLKLDNLNWRIYSKNPIMPPHYAAETAVITQSLVTEGAVVQGTVNHSVLFYNVRVAPGAVITDSVIFSGAVIGKNAVITRAIIGENAHIGDNAVIGDASADNSMVDLSLTDGITIVGNDICICAGAHLPVGAVATENSEEGGSES